MSSSGPIVVREASDQDWASIWPIIADVARVGQTFAMEANPDEASARAEWMTPAPGRVIVACDPDGALLGTANMYANRQPRDHTLPRAASWSPPRRGAVARDARWCEK